jgi:ribosomal protein S18 acetylase RimI-like enzyme
VAADRDAVLEALERCGAFTADEVRVAIEMFDDGLAGDYSLVGVEVEGVLRGYVCIGKAWLTHSSWYLYWICVHPAFHGSGVAQLLHHTAEHFVRERGGERLVLETSSRPPYERSRRFYARAGFEVQGRIADFYECGDDCLVYVKALGAADGRADPQPRQRPL